MSDGPGRRRLRNCMPALQAPRECAFWRSDSARLFDGREEIRIGTDALEAWVAPGRGGIIYELDLRTTRHNLLATLDRRPEAYHAQVLAGPGAARSIVDESQPARFKHEGLERMVHYDVARRKSLVDHFWDLDATGVGVADGEAQERGDFATGAYAATLQHAVDHVTLTLARPGNTWGIHFRLEKTITVARGGHALDIAYVLSGLPADFRQHLAVEFNFAGMPKRPNAMPCTDAEWPTIKTSEPNVARMSRATVTHRAFTSSHVASGQTGYPY